MTINLQKFSNTGDKTEKATPKKRADLRKKGNVNQSKEVSTLLMMLAIFLTLRMLGTFVYQEIAITFRFFIEESIGATSFDSTSDLMRLFSFVLIQTVKIVGPFFLVAMLFGSIGSLVQVGFLFTLEPLKPKFSRINPISGMKRLFSARSIFEMLKAVAKIGIVLLVAWSSIYGELSNLAGLMELDIRSSIAYMAKVTIDIGLNICLALFAVAAMDFAYQSRKHEKEIRMTKQEIKEEYKQMEGSPEIKSRIRQKQRDISMRRMMQAVPKADVVITNPTHLAVAISYNPEEGDAPVVLAKGADYLAARIRETATANGIRIVQNKPLAQALYTQVDIGKPVPHELYKAVAEVLAFVYGLKGKAPGQRAAK